MVIMRLGTNKYAKRMYWKREREESTCEWNLPMFTAINPSRRKLVLRAHLAMKANFVSSMVNWFFIVSTYSTKARLYTTQLVLECEVWLPNMRAHRTQFPKNTPFRARSVTPFDSCLKTSNNVTSDSGYRTKKATAINLQYRFRFLLSWNDLCLLL